MQCPVDRTPFRTRPPVSDDDAIPDLAALWTERAERVRRFQARVDPAGMTRPPRDPDERAFLAERGLLGPFGERPNADR